jgi:hypothetical protein
MPALSLKLGVTQRSVFFVFSPFLKILTNTPLLVRFQKIDPQLGAVVIGAKIIRLGTIAFSAKVLAHVVIDVDVALAWRQAWRRYYWRRASQACYSVSLLLAL